MIIGLTGSMGSGKGELVKILQGKGFKYVRLSDMVREEARKRGLTQEREVLQDIGNGMRAAGGTGVLAAKALEKAKNEGGDFVIDGIRNPGEITELRQGHGHEDCGAVYIVGIGVDKDVLVKRILGRGREGDSEERDAILAKIDRELGVGEPLDGQQVGKCMQEADIVIENNGDLKELHDRFMDYFNPISDAR